MKKNVKAAFEEEGGEKERKMPPSLYFKGLEASLLRVDFSTLPKVEGKTGVGRVFFAEKSLSFGEKWYKLMVKT